MKILVTGGAGFIGTHLCRELVHNGYDVRVLDNFSDQIHGDDSSISDDLSKVDLIKGDIRDSSLMPSAIKGVDVIVHYAAETGTGQSL